MCLSSCIHGYSSSKGIRLFTTSMEGLNMGLGVGSSAKGQWEGVTKIPAFPPSG